MRCTPIESAIFSVVEASVGAIRDRPVGKERREAAPAGVQERSLALHVQIRFLLAGKTCVGQILSGGAAAHRHVRRVQVAAAQRSSRRR